MRKQQTCLDSCLDSCLDCGRPATLFTSDGPLCESCARIRASDALMERLAVDAEREQEQRAFESDPDYQEWLRRQQPQRPQQRRKGER